MRRAIWAFVAAIVPMAAFLAGCSTSDRRLPSGPPPQVTPHELLIQHNAWVDAHTALCARADLSTFTGSSALLAALRGFRIEPKPDQDMELDDVGVHTVITEHGPGGNVSRRTWFSRYTLRPARVEVYDRGGRRVLSAEMLGYERIGAVDVCSAFRGHASGDGEVSVEIDLICLGHDARPEYRIVEHRVGRGSTEADTSAEGPSADKQAVPPISSPASHAVASPQ
jgi:hypothetical protein